MLDLDLKAKSHSQQFNSMYEALMHLMMRRAFRPFPTVANGEPFVLGIVAGENVENVQSHLVNGSYKPGAYYECTVIPIKSDKGKSLAKLEEITDALWNERLVVVSQTLDQLPADFRIVADGVIDLSNLNPLHVRAAIRHVQGEKISHDDATFIASQPLRKSRIAIRRGRPVAESVNKLRRLSVPVHTTKRTKRDENPTLYDIHGMGEAYEWGLQIASDLKDWAENRISWADVDKGVLISGPSGTGKTVFAAALARTCGVHFVSSSVGRWQSAGHLGDMLKAMYASFKEAREHAPSILFIDEIDAIGDRATFRGDYVKYMTEVVNALLENMDGTDGRDGVVVVGACNFPEKIDAALMRPGRLDRHIRIPLPDPISRIGILRWHLRGELADENFAELSCRMDGYTGADIEKLVRQARRVARIERRDIKTTDLVAQLPSLVPIPADKLWRTAVHEAGHVIVSAEHGYWHIREASIEKDEQMRNGSGSLHAGGQVLFDEKSSGMRPAAFYYAQIDKLMGGTAAEEVVLGVRSDGAGGGQGSDLHLATVTAAMLEISVGLGESLMYLAAPNGDQLMHEIKASPRLRRRVDACLGEAFERAKRIIEGQKSQLLAIAEALMKSKTLSGADIDIILNGNNVPEFAEDMKG